METYLARITPNVSNVWRTDELYLKVKGNMKYLYALMDAETRFSIAQQVADTKNTANVQPLFKEAKQIAGKRPNTLISDGAPNFADAFKNEFFTINNPRTQTYPHSGRPQQRMLAWFPRGNRKLNINTEQSIPLDYATVVTDTYSDSVRYRFHNSLCFFSRLCILSSIVRKFVVNSAIRG